MQLCRISHKNGGLGDKWERHTRKIFQSSSVVNTATPGKVMSIICSDEKSGANNHRQQANIINLTPTVSEYDDTSLAINASSYYHNSARVTTQMIIQAK